MSVEEAALTVARERLHAEAKAIGVLADRLGETFVRTAKLLGECRGKVFASGSGTSGTVARRMAHIFSVSGTRSRICRTLSTISYLHPCGWYMDGWFCWSRENRACPEARGARD